MWTEFIWLKMGSIGWLCEHGNKSWGFMKGGEFLVQLNDCQVLKELRVVVVECGLLA
jgi:hypothetical protein